MLSYDGAKIDLSSEAHEDLMRLESIRLLIKRGICIIFGHQLIFTI